MKNFVLACVLLSAGFSANAQITCIGTTSTGEKGKVEIFDDHVVVSGGLLTKPHVIKNLDIADGVITAHGLAINYKNMYGCIRDATIITEFREPFDRGYMEVMKVGTCAGGSTPDSICQPTN